MTDIPAQGAQAQLAFDDSTFDVNSEQFEFVSETLRMVQTHVESGGLRGTRSRFEDRVRIGSERVTGAIVMNPTAAELDLIWPRALGGTTSLGVTALAETVPAFNVMVDRVTKVFTYSGCSVAALVISGAAGQPLTVTLELEGQTEAVGNAGTFPAITAGIDTGNMFIFSDCTLTLAGAARKFSSFTLRLDNVLDTERFNNSLTREQIAAQDRRVTLEVDVPYTSDNSALHDAAIAGAAGSLAVSDGSVTYTFDFGNCKIPAESPVVAGRAEIQLPLRVNCYRDGANNELLVTKT